MYDWYIQIKRRIEMFLKQMVFNTSANYLNILYSMLKQIRNKCACQFCRCLSYFNIRNRINVVAFFFSIRIFSLVVLNSCIYWRKKKHWYMEWLEAITKSISFNIKTEKKEREREKKMTNTNCLWYVNNFTILPPCRIS